MLDFHIFKGMSSLWEKLIGITGPGSRVADTLSPSVSDLIIYSTQRHRGTFSHQTRSRGSELSTFPQRSEPNGTRPFWVEKVRWSCCSQLCSRGGPQTSCLVLSVCSGSVVP
ncbi:uncharacterized protein V6R79_024620 [Siganus canaliculatus]